jgi:hypothetical protein
MFAFDHLIRHALLAPVAAPTNVYWANRELIMRSVIIHVLPPPGPSLG